MAIARSQVTYLKKHKHYFATWLLAGVPNPVIRLPAFFGVIFLKGGRGQIYAIHFPI